jgi:hypothetical protein
MQYLRNSDEIKQKLQELFSKAGKKWAIVGFVGGDPLKHLPNDMSDLSIVCWPKAGGTDPKGIRKLIDKGIPVFFCDRLHHKIYWTEGVGLIIGSANLSENALGSDGLHEFGVYCEDKDFDINKVLNALAYDSVTIAALTKLDVEHTALDRREVKTKGKKQKSGSSVAPKFLEASQSKIPKEWKLVTYYALRDEAENKIIKAEVRNNWGKETWSEDIDIDANAKFVNGQHVLQVKTNDEGVIEKANAEWLCVDLIVKKGSLNVIVQRKASDKGLQPFTLDTQFKKHLKDTFNQNRTEQLEKIYGKNYFVKKSFIQAIKNSYDEK